MTESLALRLLPDKRAAEWLVAKYNDLVPSTIKRLRVGGEYEELEGAGWVGLAKAITRFDYKRNVKFERPPCDL